MKLLFTATAYPPSTGGAQLYLHMLATHLVQRNVLQVISMWDQNRTDWLLGITVNAPGNDLDYITDGVPVHRLGFRAWEKLAMAPALPIYYPWMELAAGRISAHMERKIAPYAQGVDLIHNVRIGREPLSLASLHVARKIGVPFVLTPVHHPRWKGWRYRLFDRIYREADALITLTAVEKEYLVQCGVREDRIFVTGMGPILADKADPAAFCDREKINGPMVLFLGQHFAYKGYRELLEAAPLVWKRIAQTHFVFIGPEVASSEQYFQNHRDPRIHRLGQVSLQEKTDALAACTLLCVPSSQESFGSVYTEAWSFQKPVIGCSIPAVREVIADGVDGYVVQQDPAEIASRIIDLLVHPAQAERMGAAGYQKVKARFTWEQLARLTEQVYAKVKGAL